MSFPIFSPQGDGNHLRGIRLHPCFRGGLFLSFPRKGTETTKKDVKDSHCCRLFLSFPRKGTETPFRVKSCGDRRFVFSYLFPARGRKHA